MGACTQPATTTGAVFPPLSVSEHEQLQNSLHVHPCLSIHYMEAAVVRALCWPTQRSAQRRDAPLEYAYRTQDLIFCLVFEFVCSEDECRYVCCMCREAISINQGHFRAYKLLGSALYALGDLAAAEHALRQSLAINPTYADASCDLGRHLGFSVRRVFERVQGPCHGHS